MYLNGLINGILIMSGHNNFPILKPSNHQSKAVQIIISSRLEVGYNGVFYIELGGKFCLFHDVGTTH